MIEGKKISAMLPIFWKKSFNKGVIIPMRMRFFNERIDKIMCDKCNYKIDENKGFEVNLNELKRHPPNEFGYMLPYYEK